MASDRVVRARIDGQVKEKAAKVLAECRVFSEIREVPTIANGQ